MNVIEAVSQICSDLHSGYPRVEHREVRVFGVPQTVGEVSAFDEVVDEVNVVAGDRSAEEFDDAHVVAPADDGEPLPELRGLDFAAELALENDDALGPESAAPGAGGGGGGVGFGEEVVGGGAELGEGVDVGILGERLTEFGDCGSGRVLGT